MWIEIFQVGTHRDSAGTTREYSEETLDQIAGQYNSRAGQSESELAPLVKGHPKTNDPAYGWVERLARRGKRLVARIKDLAPEISAEVAAGRFKKISIALYPDLMLRHVGLLGAAAPAVKGLRPLNFDSAREFSCYETDPGEAVESAEKKGSSEYEELISERDTLKRSNEELEARISELEHNTTELESRLRHREFSEFLSNSDALSQLPKAAHSELMTILERAWQLDQKAKSLGEYAEEDTMMDLISSFAGALGRSYLETELATGNIKQPEDNMFSGRNTPDGRMQMHRKALNMQAANPELSYEEAISNLISK